MHRCQPSRNHAGNPAFCFVSSNPHTGENVRIFRGFFLQKRQNSLKITIIVFAPVRHFAYRSCANTRMARPKNGTTHSDQIVNPTFPFVRGCAYNTIGAKMRLFPPCSCIDVRFARTPASFRHFKIAKRISQRKGWKTSRIFSVHVDSYGGITCESGIAEHGC